MVNVSRHYTDIHLDNDNFEICVAIYEDQVRGWFHDQARILEKNSDHAGFVLLLVSLAYVEGHAIFMRGKDSRNKSKEFFREGFKDIFNPQGQTQSVIDQAIDKLYGEVRCGLFHTGMTTSKVVLGRFDNPVMMVLDSTGQDVIQIRINPHKTLDQVENHLSAYVTRLRDPKEKELRKNFHKAWRLRSKA